MREDREGQDNGSIREMREVGGGGGGLFQLLCNRVLMSTCKVLVCAYACKLMCLRAHVVSRRGCNDCTVHKTW